MSLRANYQKKAVKIENNWAVRDATLLMQEIAAFIGQVIIIIQTEWKLTW